MHRLGTTMEIEVDVYATNLANKPCPRRSLHSNELRINETNLVRTDNAICGMKPEHSKRKPVETCEESGTSW
jgi:hypothetical protein